MSAVRSNKPGGATRPKDERMSDKNKDFLEGLLEASRSMEAVDAIAELVKYYAKQEPTTEEKRLRKIGNDAAWLSADHRLPIEKRKQYLEIARIVDILVDGKTQRPATLPQFRTASFEARRVTGGRE